MIKTRITRKSKGNGSVKCSSGSARGFSNTQSQPVSVNVAHARTADSATEAAHAASAGALDPDSPTRNEFLSSQHEDTALEKIHLKKGATFGDFIADAAGAAVDSAGNGEFESVKVRGLLSVYELIYNRLNALEGRTSFADSGTIETAEFSAQGGWLTMRKRWDGDLTSFQVGDIIYGYVNDLENGGSAYRCWGAVREKDTVGNRLYVELYDANDTPEDVASPEFRAEMLISRWGNWLAPTAANHLQYPEVIAAIADGDSIGYVNTRRTSFFVDCEAGNIVQLNDVAQPILSRENYGTVLGTIPEGVVPTDIYNRLNHQQPYLFARGIVVQDLIRLDYRPVTLWTLNSSVGALHNDTSISVTATKHVEGQNDETISAGDGAIELYAYKDDAPLGVKVTDWSAVNVGGVGAKLTLTLCDSSGTLATLYLHVIRDGEKGDRGSTGAMAYYAGDFDSHTTYTATETKRPYVSYSGALYALKEGRSYLGVSTRYSNPAADVANNTNTAWEMMTDFDIVFTKLLLADQAQVGRAVFSGDYLISKSGVTSSGNSSEHFELFDPDDLSVFHPNFYVNLKTGDTYQRNGTFAGEIESFFRDIDEVAKPTLDGTASVRLLKTGGKFLCVSDGMPVVLSKAAACIGKRVLLCNPTGTYTDGTLSALTRVKAQSGGKIVGVLRRPNGVAYAADGTSGGGFEFGGGCVELVGIPRAVKNGNNVTYDKTICDWLVVNASSYFVN